MSTVDAELATDAARKTADREVQLMYPNQRNTPEAHRTWSRIFWKEYWAYVSPAAAIKGEQIER
jgi:hypothetical protein